VFPQGCRLGEIRTGFEPYPDRAAIEDGALWGRLARPVVFCAIPVDALIIQVQGSARIRLPTAAVAGSPMTGATATLSPRSAA
jgi:membrane-bound lytic murein transglycosylase